MSSPRSSNRPSAKTYRNRRIIALAVLVVLVVILWNVVAGILGFFGGIFHHGDAKPASTASATALPSPGAIGDCAAGSIVVKANVGVDTTPQSVFAAKIKPSFWFTLTNTGTAACNFNAGTKVSFFTVTSGKEVIWDNKDCKTRATSDVDYVMALQPGQTVSSNPSTWDRVYSSSKGCDATTEKAVAAGGASYHLTSTVNGVKSTDVQFILQ